MYNAEDHLISLVITELAEDGEFDNVRAVNFEMIKKQFSDKFSFLNILEHNEWPMLFMDFGEESELLYDITDYDPDYDPYGDDPYAHGITMSLEDICLYTSEEDLKANLSSDELEDIIDRCTLMKDLEKYSQDELIDFIDSTADLSKQFLAYRKLRP